MRILKKIWPQLIAFNILISIILIYAITNNSVQIFDYDMVEQGARFVIRGYRWFQNFNYPLWDWNHFFGASIFVHGYYFLFTPFSLLFNFLPNIDWIPYAFLYVNILKLLFLFMTSFIYFSRIRKTMLSSFIGASILTFCGFTMGYYNYSHFIDTFVFVPLALYFIEDFIEKGSYFGFTLTIMIMSMINGYFLYLFTVYFFVYGLFRYFMLQTTFSWKHLIKTSINFTLFYLLGLGLGSLVFLPTITAMLGSSRLNVDLNIFKIVNRFDVFRFFTGFLSPVVDRNNFNPFINVNNVPSYGWSGGSAVYSFIITPLLATQVFNIKIKKSNKLILGSVILLFFILSLFPSSYVLLNGSNDTRWMVIFTLLLSYLITIVIDEIDDINVPILMGTGLVILASFPLSFFISNRYNLQQNEIYLEIAYRNSILLASFIIVYLMFFVYLKRFKWSRVVLVLLIVFESYLSLGNIFFNPIKSTSMSYEDMKGYLLTDFTMIDAIKAMDSGTYRIDAIEDAGFNNSLSKDYLGFSFYSSVYNFELDTFIQNNIASAGGWIVGSNPGKWQFKTMFGAKYWFDTQKKFSPPFGYKYVKSIQYDDKDIDVYENMFSVPLVYAMENTLDYDSWIQLDGLHKMHTLMSNVVTESSQDMSPDYPNTLFKLDTFGNLLTYEFEQNQSHAIIYVSYPRSEEVRINLYLDDELIDSHYSYEPQYSSIYTTNTFNRAEIEVSNLYGVPESEFINTAYIEYPNETYPQWHANLIDEAATDVELLDNSFKAKINLKSDKWIVTSIAYDDDWTVSINGEKVDIEKVNGGFIGFMGKVGENVITASYFPRILKIAIGVFTLSVVTFIFLLYKGKNRKQA